MLLPPVSFFKLYVFAKQGPLKEKAGDLVDLLGNSYWAKREPVSADWWKSII